MIYAEDTKNLSNHTENFDKFNLNTKYQEIIKKLVKQFNIFLQKGYKLKNKKSVFNFHSFQSFVLGRNARNYKFCVKCMNWFMWKF